MVRQGAFSRSKKLLNVLRASGFCASCRDERWNHDTRQLHKGACCCCSRCRSVANTLAHAHTHTHPTCCFTFLIFVQYIGALFVLDCIASGCMWVDMEHTGVDVLISAPQKGASPVTVISCRSQHLPLPRRLERPPLLRFRPPLPTGTHAHRLNHEVCRFSRGIEQ